MKPDYQTMSKPDLIAHLLEHREDLEALDALVERRSPDSEATWFQPPQTPAEEQQQFEQFKQLIDRQGQSHNR